MQKYLDFINRLLEKQEEPCYLPGIGILKFREEPAKENTGNNELYPPHTYIVFEKTENPTPPYCSVVRKIKEDFNLSDEDATAEWDKTIEFIKKKFAEEGEIVFPGTGKLILSNQKQLKFVESPEKYTLFPTVSFLPPASLTPPSDREVETDEKIQNKKKWLWLIPVGILILAGIGFGLYQYRDTLLPVTGKPDTHSNATTLDNYEKSTPPAPAPDSAISQKNIPPATPDETSQDSIHFLVIYAVYPSRKIAERHYKQMHAWGHEVSIYTKDSIQYQLGYSYFELPEDTTKRLEKIKKTYGGNPSIVYPKK